MKFFINLDKINNLLPLNEVDGKVTSGVEAPFPGTTNGGI